MLLLLLLRVLVLVLVSVLVSVLVWLRVLLRLLLPPPLPLEGNNNDNVIDINQVLLRYPQTDFISRVHWQPLNGEKGWPTATLQVPPPPPVPPPPLYCMVTIILFEGYGGTIDIIM